jgi:hypothetical protein
MDKQSIRKYVDRMVIDHSRRQRLTESGDVFKGRQYNYYCDMYGSYKRQWVVYDTHLDTFYHVSWFKGKGIPSDDPEEIAWSIKTEEELGFEIRDEIREELVPENS